MRGFPRSIGKWLLFALMACSLGSVLCPSSPSMAQENGTELQANLDDVLVEDFIKFIGKYTGRNIIYRTDQIPKVKFNIYSQSPIGEPELLAIFHEVLASIGLKAVAKEGVVYVMPNNLAKNIDAPVERGMNPGLDEELVTTVYQLADDVPDKAAQTLLKTMSSPVGIVQPIPQAQAVLIRDTRDRIEKMLQLLESIQAIRPQWKMEFVKLKEAEGSNVTKTITQVYGQMLKDGRIAELPLLVDIPWSNSFLVAGSPEVIDDIKSLASMMDHVDETAAGIKIYRLQNSKAKSVAEVLQSLVQVVVDAKKQQVKTVSNAFKVSADEETNSVIVFGNKEIFAQVENVIDELDRPQDQVFIEAVIMETTLENSREFGVEWMVGSAETNNLGTIGFIGDSTSSSLLSYAEPVMDEDTSPPNLAALASGFSLGVLGNIVTYGGQRFPTLGAMINFAKSASQINILSTPQVMTLDNSEAEVFVGENRPFLTTEKYDSNNNPVQSYDYRDVGYKLKVLPQINSNSGLVRLDIEQEVKKVTDTSVRPVTLTRYTKTTVQLLDGSTVVISGLVRDDLDRSQNGIPGLANIPLLGWFFKTDSKSGQKSTLMIFIRAKIVRTMAGADALTGAKRQLVEETNKNSESYFEKQFELNWWGDGNGTEERYSPTDYLMQPLPGEMYRSNSTMEFKSLNLGEPGPAMEPAGAKTSNATQAAPATHTAPARVEVDSAKPASAGPSSGTASATAEEQTAAPAIPAKAPGEITPND